MQTSVDKWSITRFYTFLFLVTVFGITQGFLIPVISTMLEQMHLTPSVNGFSAAMLYVGMLFSMMFYSKLISRWGYRNTIIVGISILLISFVLFPFTYGIWWWSVLRFLVGIGNNIALLSCQVWLIATVDPAHKGKRLAQFGLMYGLGFGIGPLGLNLISHGYLIPFIALIILLVVSLIVSFRLTKGYANFAKTNDKQQEVSASYKTVYKISFLAMIPMLLYGILEVALSGNFPVYGLKLGLTKGEISLLITAFIWGSLVFQLPLGMLGDKIGRKNLLRILCSLGGFGMLFVPLVGDSFLGLFIILGLSGGFVGSLFSLGLAFMDDILPAHLLPKGSALCSMHYSVGSIIGPYLGGTLMQYMGISSLFYFLGLALIGFVALTFVFRSYGITKKEAIIETTFQ
ncbi:MFS transporter [Shimazuella sp. AN120528]|uniref:MFS transporter n=1 Tax=Shimazuella soli TaxID=1892854 RepID=UPI001F0FECC4|nr:MFS transporter [Shimazuella soli]MCH5584819.1 MFS transporter [Shimazuella soli]